MGGPLIKITQATSGLGTEQAACSVGGFGSPFLYERQP
jgi:hypothetical protein